MGLPNMVPGSVRWKPPRAGVEREVEKIIRKRLHFLLPEKEIDAIITRRKPTQKWMVEIIEEFNQVDRRFPNDLGEEIKRRNALKLKFDDTGTKTLEEMRVMAKTASEPNTFFFSKARSYLQAQQFIFENESAISIREFVVETRKNKGKFTRAAYWSILRYIHDCKISAEVTREILGNPRYLRIWAEDQFAELRQK